MISVMLAMSHVVMLSRMAQSSFKTLHKIGFGYCKLIYDYDNDNNNIAVYILLNVQQ